MQLHFVIYCRISDSVSYPVESALKGYIGKTVSWTYYNTHLMSGNTQNIVFFHICKRAKWITARLFLLCLQGISWSILLFAILSILSHANIYFLCSWHQHTPQTVQKQGKTASYHWIYFCSSFYWWARFELTKGSTDSWQYGWKNTHNHKIIKNCATEQCISFALAEGILVWWDKCNVQKETSPNLKMINGQVKLAMDIFNQQKGKGYFINVLKCLFNKQYAKLEPNL